MERDLILKVLQENHWNRRKSAEVLKISYRALLYKVRQAGLPAKRLQRKIGDGSGPLEIENDSPAEVD
jgi:DNA-binding NtrC family response regulator